MSAMDPKEVYFDLETTGLLQEEPHITQIAAVGPMGEFNEYVMPDKPINPEASRVTGIKVEEGQMYFKGEKVNALGIVAALTKLFDFLGEGVTLVGHNAHRFDFPVLYKAVVACDMLEKLTQSVAEVLDTWTLFRDIQPGMFSYRQVHLVAELLGESYGAHNALADVTSLKKLVTHVAPSDENKAMHTASADYLIFQLHF